MHKVPYSCFIILVFVICLTADAMGEYMDQLDKVLRKAEKKKI